MKKVSTQQTGRQYDYRIKEEKNKATARQVLISEEIFFIPFPSRRERTGGPVSILPREFQLCVTTHCLESRFFSCRPNDLATHVLQHSASLCKPKTSTLPRSYIVYSAQTIHWAPYLHCLQCAKCWFEDDTICTSSFSICCRYLDSLLFPKHQNEIPGIV